ncbi:hypothetical protein GOV13_02530 [Candidatus Pacearchaeota archaeon]|nr:hypothetical protein [Candidatus Pacearchaeota archaeon]
MAEVKTIPEIIKDVTKREAESEHKLFYDSATEQLEPIYFWLLDLMNDSGLEPEKLIDNFASSTGSGHFSEMGQRATVMQQQGMKVMGDINTVLRSVLNLVYDLKEFKIRLQSYDDLKESNKEEAAKLSLKQIWLDKVDINKGNSSIKAMALGQAGFQTLLDAFLAANTIKEVKDIDLNDRIKRILYPRIQEFNHWLVESEKELRKRYSMERTYLKSQANSLKLYSRWAKPYLKAAAELEQKDMGRNPALVKSFSTTLLELTLFGKSEIKELPPELGKIKMKRKYYSCVLVDFKFRGIPQRVTQRGDYSFGGRTEITFKSYALNEDEIKKIMNGMDKQDMSDVLGLIEGATTEGLGQLQEEIDFFLEEGENEAEEKKKHQKKSSGQNPFSALFGRYEKSTEKKKEDKKEGKSENKDKPLKKDDWVERTHVRPLAAETSKNKAFDLFNIYKKAHDMATYI